MAADALGLADLVAAMPDASAVLDQQGRVVVHNAAWADVDPAIGHLFGDGASGAAVVVRGSDILGEHRFFEVVARPIGGSGDFVLANCREVTQSGVVPIGEATHGRDELTGMASRGLLVELLRHALMMAERHHYRPAVVAVGVELLEGATRSSEPPSAEVIVSIASRLKSSLRPGDVVARSGDSQFMVLLPDVDNEYAAELIARRLIAEMTHPVRLRDGDVDVELLTGLVVADATIGAESMVTSAEAALEQSRGAKSARQSVAVSEVLLDPSASSTTPRRSSAPTPDAAGERRIDLADLRQEELVSYFQPIFDNQRGAVVAGEALMRWRHPHYGVLSAGEFLGLAVNSGLVSTLTDQALVCSAETWVDIRDQLGDSAPRLFVNLSPNQLLSRVAVERLFHLLVATALPADEVVVEVTEEAMSTQFNEMLAVLNELRGHGLRIALDDFGSGYSSLGRLRHLPVDVIKVDQSMVRGLEADTRARRLLGSIATMATDLELECIVEGVETAGEAAIIEDLGFRYVQGYHFARPCPSWEFVKIVDPTSGVTVDEMSVASPTR